MLSREERQASVDNVNSLTDAVTKQHHECLPDYFCSKVKFLINDCALSPSYFENVDKPHQKLLVWKQCIFLAYTKVNQHSNTHSYQSSQTLIRDITKFTYK